MKHFLYVLVAICSPMLAISQDITGLWQGTMHSDSTNQTLAYEVVITKSNGKYSGYSHTWFVINDKKYYGVKKLKVRVAKDGKLVLQDAELVANDYPIAPLKNVFQLNVLDISSKDGDISLSGIFVTNRTREYSQLTGSIDIKKVNPADGHSELVRFFQKTGVSNELTVVK